MELKRYFNAPDKYHNIHEFVQEFTNDLNDEFEVNWGLDFLYKGKKYHFCRYQMESDSERQKFSNLLNRDLSKVIYEIAIIDLNFHNEFSISPDTTILGLFDSIQEVIECDVIENTMFSKILLDANTIITGRD